MTHATCRRLGNVGMVGEFWGRNDVDSLWSKWLKRIGCRKLFIACSAVCMYVYLSPRGHRPQKVPYWGTGRMNEFIPLGRILYVPIQSKGYVLFTWISEAAGDLYAPKVEDGRLLCPANQDIK